MKFLIQKINKEIRHDFAFTLIDMIRFKNWLSGNPEIKMRFLDYDTENIPEPDDIYPIPFKDRHKEYIPIGSVEFVTEFLQYFYGLTPKPINVPHELFHYAGREIFNGNEKSIDGKVGRYFLKSNDKIKGYIQVIEPRKREQFIIQSEHIPNGNYQISEYISIESEWRAFVYEGKLVGLHNYAGEFTKWPNENTIKGMIGNYKSAPVAYTLDIGISDDRGTFILECHDFFSCGLYGFNQPILVNMFYKWFKEYLKINNK